MQTHVIKPQEQLWMPKAQVSFCLSWWHNSVTFLHAVARRRSYPSRLHRERDAVHLKTSRTPPYASLPLADSLRPFSAINTTTDETGFSEFCEPREQVIKTGVGSGKLSNLQLISEVGTILCPCGWLIWMLWQYIALLCVSVQWTY